MPSRNARRAISTLLAGTFVFSLAGVAYGWNDCPRHRADDRTKAASAAVSVDTGGRPSGPRSTEASCTCIGLCHGAAASPLPSIDTPEPAPCAAVRVRSVSVASHQVPGELSPFFLPYPNGPPSA